MISIEIDRNQAGQVVGCHIDGHAGYDNHGYDIVCAAVSVLSCTAILGLQERAGQEGDYSNASGSCEMVLRGSLTPSGQDILETMILGLAEVSRQYPEFVQISDK